PGSDEIFEQLKENSANYDFANNKRYQGNEKNAARLTVAINLGFDWQLQIRKALAFKLAAHFVYAPLPERNQKYKPVDKTSDEFQSIYNSTAKTSYSAFGVNFGFVYRF
ncbi:MAG TPA: hypothetical protein PL045_11395, partial [Chitinophagaceae bacterium]|nr:hypothetical protein [Chitinophagaceae bacterium]